VAGVALAFQVAGVGACPVVSVVVLHAQHQEEELQKNLEADQLAALGVAEVDLAGTVAVGELRRNLAAVDLVGVAEEERRTAAG